MRPQGFNMGINQGGRPAPGSPTTCTCTCSRAGSATRTSCRPWETCASCRSTSTRPMPCSPVGSPSDPRPGGLQGLRRPRASTPTRSTRRAAGGRRGLRRRHRREADRARARRPPVLAVDGRGRRRGGARGRAPTSSSSGSARPRCSTSPSPTAASTAGVCVTASHNPPQYTGAEDGPRGRAAAVGRLRHRRGRADRRRRAAGRAARRDPRARRGLLGALHRPLHVVRRPRGDPRPAGRDRRGQRDGRALPPPASSGSPSTPCPSSSTSTAPSPTTSRTRSCRRTASSSSARSGRRAPTSASPSTATPTAASSSTTRASSCPATSSRPCSRSHLLERAGPATVVYDLRASWAVRDTVPAAGGTPDMWRVGHAFIKRRMREVDALFAGEVSGHYYFRDFFYADTGLVPALLVMEMVATAGRPLSEMVAGFRERYHVSGEINSTVDDVPGGHPAPARALRRRQPVRDRRPLGRVRRLALQRAALEHRAAAAAQPRVARVRGGHGAPPRRGAGGDPLRVTGAEAAQPLVAADGLEVRYHGGPDPAVRDVSLRLGPGEGLLVAGPAGAGKTSLLRGLLGLVPLAGRGAGCPPGSATGRRARLRLGPARGRDRPDDRGPARRGTRARRPPTRWRARACSS